MSPLMSCCEGGLTAVLGEHLLVILLVERDDPGGTEAVLRSLAGGFAHGIEAALVGEQTDGAFAHCIDVADGEETAVDSVIDELRHAADGGGDSGHAAGHGL